VNSSQPKLRCEKFNNNNNNNNNNKGMGFSVSGRTEPGPLCCNPDVVQSVLSEQRIVTEGDVPGFVKTV